MNIILGAGIAGISAAYHLHKNGREYRLYEKNDSWGGLCDNFTVGGFLFDYFVHLSFTSNDYVRNIFAESTPFRSHRPVSYNYYKGIWLKHPAQNNLAPLSAKEKIDIIKDFVNRPNITPTNYREWLTAQFGKYFTDNFPAVYAEKYWTAPAEELGIDWTGNRFSLPELEDILKGAFEEREENHYYATEMRYPVKGGYKAFLNAMVKEIKICTNKEAMLIDAENKRIEFSDGSKTYYDTLISSVPLPELVKIIKDCPAAVSEAGADLLVTSGQLVSLGFNRPDVPKYLWAYVYDEDIFPARMYSPSLKSPANVPQGKSSLQFEVYFSRRKPCKLKGDALLEHVVAQGEKMKLFSKTDVEIADYREVKYANVVFDGKRKQATKIIHDYLDRLGIKYIGRFGEWDYLWSDQSLLSGKKVM